MDYSHDKTVQLLWEIVETLEEYAWRLRHNEKRTKKNVERQVDELRKLIEYIDPD